MSVVTIKSFFFSLLLSGGVAEKNPFCNAVLWTKLQPSLAVCKFIIIYTVGRQTGNRKKTRSCSMQVILCKLVTKYCARSINCRILLYLSSSRSQKRNNGQDECCNIFHHMTIVSMVFIFDAESAYKGGGKRGEDKKKKRNLLIFCMSLDIPFEWWCSWTIMLKTSFLRGAWNQVYILIFSMGIQFVPSSLNFYLSRDF